MNLTDTEKKVLKLAIESAEGNGHDFGFVNDLRPAVKIRVTEGPVKGRAKLLLTRKKLLKGLGVMAQKYPRHYGNWLAGQDDAETGDVFIQCALFGEIVFG